MVHNLEPAVYLDGIGSLRLNDNVAVRQDGIDVWVNDTSKQLWIDMHAGSLALAGLDLAGVAADSWRGIVQEDAMIQHTLRPKELSQQLRNGTGACMAQRRGIVSLSLVAVGSMGLITLEQKTKQHAFCSWCFLAASTTVAIVPLAIPETWAAVREVIHRIQH